MQEDELIQERLDRTVAHLHLIASHLVTRTAAPMSLEPGSEEAEAAVQSFATTMRELSLQSGDAAGPPLGLQAGAGAEDKAPAVPANGHGPVETLPQGATSNGHADVVMGDEDDNEEVSWIMHLQQHSSTFCMP